MLYRGRQQDYVSDATDVLRGTGDTVERVFVSAGFGVVDEDTVLPPYDVTFGGPADDEIDARAEKLGIHEDVRDQIEGDTYYDIVFFTLGRAYYRSIGLEAVLEALPDATIGVLFNQEEVAARFENVVSVSARNGDACEHGTIVVALKGRYLQHFAEHRSHGAEVTGPDDVVEYCTTEYTTQTGFGDYDA